MALSVSIVHVSCRLCCVLLGPMYNQKSGRVQHVHGVLETKRRNNIKIFYRNYIIDVISNDFSFKLQRKSR